MKLSDKEKHINILFEDNHLLIAEKPSPLATQPAANGDDSLEARLKKHIKLRDNKQGGVYLQCIHRLDKKVGGIVIFAKTSKALKRLQQMQREKKFEKKYVAQVCGHVSMSECVLTNYLVHGDYKAHISNKDDKRSKLARLSYRVIDYHEKSTIVEITLDTGRYHQIRAQLGYIGHPIVGDKKYGSPFDYDSIMLYHFFTFFKHPVTLKQLNVRFLPSHGRQSVFLQFDKHLKQPL